MFDAFHGMVLARREGLRVRQVFWVFFWGVSLLSYVEARQIATHAQLRVAVKRGIDLRDYIRAVKAGARPDQVIEAHDKAIDIFDYGAALKVGASPDQVIQAHEKSIDVFDYFLALTAGKSHEEAIGILKR